jgi:hypothetical protein
VTSALVGVYNELPEGLLLLQEAIKTKSAEERTSTVENFTFFLIPF